MYLHANLNVYTASIVFGSVLTNWISPSAKDETEAFFFIKKRPRILQGRHKVSPLVYTVRHVLYTFLDRKAVPS